MKTNLFWLFFLMSFSLFAREMEVAPLQGIVRTSKSLTSRRYLIKKSTQAFNRRYYFTEDQSMLRLRLLDNSIVTLGPKSILFVNEIQKGREGLISLIQGTARITLVASSEERAFLVKTGSLIVKAHENDFMVFHDRVSNYSSVMTMQGKSDAFYVANPVNASVEVEREGLQNKLKKVSYGRVKERASLREVTNYVKDKKHVEVKKGQVSYTLKALETLSLPTKISRVQYNILFKNSDLRVKRNHKVTGIEASELTKNIPLKADDQSAPLEGMLDIEKREFAPKSGGFLDLSTGIYVQPSSKAIYFAKDQSYFDDSVGEIDKETGQYKPILGLKLDHKAGFIKRGLRAGAPSSLESKLESNQKRMNELLDLQIVNGKAGDKESFQKAKTQFSTYSNRELISKNNLILSVSFFKEEMKIEGANFTPPKTTYESDTARQYKLMWEQKSFKKWQPFFAVGITEFEYSKNELGSLNQAGDSLSLISAGAKYSLSSRWNALFHFMFDQKYVFNPSNASSTQDISQVAIPKVGVSFEGALIRSGRFSLENSLLATLSLSKKTGNLKVGQGFGFQYEAIGRYWFKRNFWSGLGGFFRQESYDITNSGSRADIKYDSSGIVAKFGYTFE